MVHVMVWRAVGPPCRTHGPLSFHRALFLLTFALTNARVSLRSSEVMRSRWRSHESDRQRGIRSYSRTRNIGIGIVHVSGNRAGRSLVRVEKGRELEEPEEVKKYTSGQDILEELRVSSTDIHRLQNIAQRYDNGTMHPLWLQARRFRITASEFSKSCDPSIKANKITIWNKLWKFNSFDPAQGSEWGVRMEGTARMHYEKHIQSQDPNARVLEVGIGVNPDFPYLSCSPDGIVHTSKDGKGLLEIKCPIRRMPREGAMPKRHKDQIQGSMGILGLDWCDYVVWMPGRMQVTRYNFDKGYFYNTLLPNLKQFYLNELLPYLVLKENELLIEFSLTPKHPLPPHLKPKWMRELEDHTDDSDLPRGKLLRRLEKKAKKFQQQKNSAASATRGLGFGNSTVRNS